MKIQETIHDWQGWLDKFLKGATAEGWAEFMALPDDDDILPWHWAAMYPALLQNDLARAMLLACLQLPPMEAEAALATMARKAHALRFDKPPHSLKRDIGKIYPEAARNMLRDLPAMADFFHSIFLHYLRDDYDLADDANWLMREAQALAEMRQRERALDRAGRAAALALRGKHFWDGWSDEGAPEFRHWALSLTSLLEAHADWLPLGAIADERARVAERVAALSPDHPSELRAESVDEPLPPYGALPQEFIDEWTAILQRDEPLSDADIVAMGERYTRVCDNVKTVLSATGSMPLPVAEGDMMGLLARMVGTLRYTDDFAITRMFAIIKNPDGEHSDEAIENAVWALQQLGRAALQPCLDFARYSSLDDARDDVLEVLGVVGRGSAEAYDYLAQQFMDTSWDEGKSRYAYPLALLRDARAIPMMADALSDPSIGEEEAWELLDALQELGVEFAVDEETRAVTIPEYGTIENVLPRNWVSRAQAEQVEAVLANDEAPAEDEDDDEGITYDARGVAHCADCGAAMQWIGGRWVHPPIDDEMEDEVEFDAHGVPRCPGCGAVMKKIGGRWVHPPDALAFPPQKPVRVEKVGRNDPCPCGSGKKYKHCHGSPGAAVLN